jgi:hypothetical protein
VEVKEMGSIRGWQRAGALILAMAVIAMLTPSSVSAARFTIAGTVYSANEANETFIIITDDIGGTERPITVDMSRFSRIFGATEVGTPIKLVIEDRPFDTYKAVDLLEFGSYVNPTDFGVEENFTVRDDSIHSHVGNVPEDDEALAKQNRGSDLRKHGDSDD